MQNVFKMLQRKQRYETQNIFLKMVIYCQKYSYMVIWLELF